MPTQRSISRPGPAEARQLITSAPGTVLVRFSKKNGEIRRMWARFNGDSSRKPTQLVVWDCEKGGRRTINLDAVESLQVLQGARHEPVRTYADVKREIDQLFY